jgi:cytochrome P450
VVCHPPRRRRVRRVQAGPVHTLAGLLAHPDQLAALRADPAALLPAVVEEGVRWVAPIGTQTRQAVADVELGGAIVPARAPAGALVSSACRDEARFDDPDRPPVFRGWEFRAPRNLDVLLLGR